MVKTLSHKMILQGDASVHISRATLSAVRPKELHTHDFHELFWVQNGRLRHHLPNRMDVLSEGDLVLMHPGQTHALQGKGEAAMVVALCLHPDVMAGLAKRHKGLIETGSDEPQTMHRDMRQLAALNQAVLQLENSPMDRLAAEAFLLPLLSGLRAPRLPADAPGWLSRVVAEAQSAEVFRDGAAGLVRVAGRAHPHVSRTMRAVLGQSPSEYVNRVRMDYAARQLTSDTEAIKQIAADCGIPNMAHFHKLFRAHHGLTPLQYRRKFQRDILQP